MGDHKIQMKKEVSEENPVTSVREIKHCARKATIGTLTLIPASNPNVRI